MTENVKPMVPPPPRAPNRGLLMPVPKTEAPTDNLSKPVTALQDLNFKMDPDFHRAFKAVATLRGMSMKELLEASFRCWLEHYGDDQLRMLLPKI